MKSKSLTIFISPIEAWGHINACLGIAESLQARGHRVIFVVNSSLDSFFTDLGYEEFLLHRSTEKKSSAETFLQTAERYKRQFGRTVIEYHIKFGEDAIVDMVENFETTQDYDPQFEMAIQQLKPDLFIGDGYYLPSSIVRHQVPTIRNWSCNPLMIYNLQEGLIAECVPPFGSGLDTENSSKIVWKTIMEHLKTNFFSVYQKFQQRIYELGNIPLEDYPDFSKTRYIYGFPRELDYSDLFTTPSNWFQIDSFCRNQEPKKLNLPKNFYNPLTDRLIFFSLGTIASIDVELMRQIANIFGQLPQYKFIFVKGSYSKEYDLPANCYGDEMLPQIAAIRMSALTITHGGNNTVTESLTLGKPMIVMPMFFDQFDNAQRVQEKGYGVRMDPYNFDKQDLEETIETILNDTKIIDRCEKISARIHNTNRKDLLCEWIEEYCLSK